MQIKKYILNCFLLLIPILIWNILFYDDLPPSYGADIFWKDIPAYITYPENILRLIVLSFPILMSLSIKSKIQKIGLVVFIIGVVIYFLSWLALIIYPESNWSNSLIGFTAPAYTTLIWFIGIGLIGNRTFIKIPKISLLYIATATLFVVFHTTHAYIVFKGVI